MRKLFAAALAASFCVWGPSQGWGQEPSRLQLSPSGIAGAVNTSSNQHLADAIADKLNQSPRLKHFRVNITVQDGEAELAGTVLNHGQRAEVVQLAQAVPGVLRVRDRIQVVSAGDVQLAQASPFPPLPLQPVLPGGDTGDKGDKLPKTIVDPKDPKGGKVIVDPKDPKQPFPPLPMPPFPAFPPLPVQPGPGGPGGPGVGPGGMLEPMPLQGAPPGFPSATQPPPLPPNAWPTYAPYNNYARVAYPNLYPYESFPFIGPFYPFPKVPLGWRSVTLSWEDGNWWIGRNATGHDWWRVRYW